MSIKLLKDSRIGRPKNLKRNKEIYLTLNSY